MAGVPKSQRAPELRFWSKVSGTEDPDGCWMWTASLSKGYGQFMVRKGVIQMAHLWAWEHLIGVIPEGLDLDHLCHDPAVCAGGNACLHRRCVNPAHLEPVTRRTNLLRGGTLPAKHAALTHCLHGHPFNQDNTLVSKGVRYCRACMARRRSEARARAKAVTDKIN